MKIDLSSQEQDDLDVTPYSNPDKYGFEPVDEIEWDNESYQFNITCVLRRKSDGTLWYASDSGCSCPCPFEDTFEWDRLFNFEPLQEMYNEHTKSDEYRRSYSGLDLSQWNTFEKTVKQALEVLSVGK